MADLVNGGDEYDWLPPWRAALNRGGQHLVLRLYYAVRFVLLDWFGWLVWDELDDGS